MRAVRPRQPAHPAYDLPYSYAKAQPWKTQYWSRQVTERLYNLLGTRLSGRRRPRNGMSLVVYFEARWAFGDLPSTDQYVIGSPCSARATITMEETAEVRHQGRRQLAAKNVYIQSATLNGKSRSTKSPHKDIADGGVINC